MNIIDYAVSYIVHNTEYSAYQVYRVIELITKWGDKTEYHLCNKKQKEILKMLVYLLTPPTEGEKD